MKNEYEWLTGSSSVVPAPKKRAAEDEGAGPTTRSAKAPKTEKAESSPKAGRGRGGKKGLKVGVLSAAADEPAVG